MEVLERLSRRQIDALLAVRKAESPERGASLNAIARELRVRAPSALTHLTVLEHRGLVTRYRGKTKLSARGEACLSEYHRHHRVAENLFQRLGLGAADTHAAALEVDLALSHRMVDRLCEAEGHPTQCPHGEPIEPCHRPDTA